jgi:FkbM family methyltransferase
MKFEDFKLNPLWPDSYKDIYKDFYKEIWYDNEYDRYGISVSKDDVVVDLGASIGVFSKYAKYKGASRVYSFECFGEHFKYLKENIIPSDNIIPVYGLVSGSESEMIIGSSIVKSKSISFIKNHYNLKRIIKDFNLNSIDFMKVDIEGAEYDFILNANDIDLNKVKKWAIELHVWGMFTNKADEYFKIMQIIEKFSKNGYKIYCDHIHKTTCLYMLYATK